MSGDWIRHTKGRLVGAKRGPLRRVCRVIFDPLTVSSGLMEASLALRSARLCVTMYRKSLVAFLLYRTRVFTMHSQFISKSITPTIRTE